MKGGQYPSINLRKSLECEGVTIAQAVFAAG